jgi:hypothetical protein
MFVGLGFIARLARPSQVAGGVGAAFGSRNPVIERHAFLGHHSTTIFASTTAPFPDDDTHFVPRIACHFGSHGVTLYAK